VPLKGMARCCQVTVPGPSRALDSVSQRVAGVVAHHRTATVLRRSRSSRAVSSGHGDESVNVGLSRSIRLRPASVVNRTYFFVRTSCDPSGERQP